MSRTYHVYSVSPLPRLRNVRGDLSLFLLTALLASLPLTVAFAQGATYLVIGTAMLDGESAMMGTMVVAMVGDEKVGEGEVFNEMGQYRLPIEGGNVGDTVMISLIMGEGDEMVEYMASTDGDVMIGASGDVMMVDLMAFSGVLPLSVRPAMAVPGQQILIEGSGFVAGDRISSVSIGNQTAGVYATADSAGDIVIAVNVPSSPRGPGIGFGKKIVSVTATGSGRVAEGSIEIPKAAITLDPMKSRRGSTVKVSGSGFPSGDLVQVKYDNDGTFVTVAAGSADASGAVSIDFTVPSYARIGSTHNIEVTSVGVYKSVTARATHETPDAMVTLSTDTISSGENITITGRNFPAFATVAVMEIGGIDVRSPCPPPATSIDGDFESTVLVPLLEPGIQTVSIRVGQTSATTFLEIDTSVPVPPAQERPDATVTLSSDTISSGENITITGRNFPAFTKVAVIEIGRVNIRPCPAPATSIDGSFESTVLVPLLELGFQTVWVRVGQTTATTFLEIVASVPRANDPRAPTISSVFTGAGFLTVTWVAPAGSVGPAVTAYDLRYIPSTATDKSDSNWTVVNDAWTAGAGALSYRIVGLVGGTHYDVQVRAVTVAGEGPWSATVAAKTTDETQAATVTLSSDTISSGENITITGRNFPALAAVAVMDIGGVDVRPVPAPRTSIDGDFESTVLVPQLESRVHTVSVRVGPTSVTTTLEIVASVPQANEHSATRSFTATTVEPGGEITVDIALSEYGRGGSVTETLPEGFTYVSGSIEFVGGRGIARPSGNRVNVVLAGAGVTNVIYKVTAPSEAGGPFEFTGTFVNLDGESVDIGGDSTVTVAADAGTPASYDSNRNGIIELPELFDAIDDYFADEISLTVLFDIIDFYFSGDRVE